MEVNVIKEVIKEAIHGKRVELWREIDRIWDENLGERNFSYAMALNREIHSLKEGLKKLRSKEWR